MELKMIDTCHLMVMLGLALAMVNISEGLNVSSNDVASDKDKQYKNNTEAIAGAWKGHEDANLFGSVVCNCPTCPEQTCECGAQRCNDCPTCPTCTCPEQTCECGAQICPTCPEQSCECGDNRFLMRLAGENSDYRTKGRLEVFHGGEWGTVCDDFFDDRAATVACRDLGYARGVAHDEAFYGEGTGPILLDNIVCGPRHTSLWQCSHTEWGEENCSHSEDVGVECF